MFENVLFSEYSTLNFTFSMMAGLALEEGETAYAKFLAEKISTLSRIFDMGKYNEYVPMLNIVCAEKNVEGTYKVVEQLLENVDGLYDFQKSKLYMHKKFKDTDGSYLEVIKEKMLESFCIVFTKKI